MCIFARTGCILYFDRVRQSRKLAAAYFIARLFTGTPYIGLISRDLHCTIVHKEGLGEYFAPLKWPSMTGRGGGAFNKCKLRASAIRTP